MTIAEALAQAFGHHVAGRLAPAEQLYGAILQTDPNHVDALQLLGMVLDSTGRSEQAVEYLRAALKLKPDFPEVLNNLSSILARQGKYDEACAGFREAIRLRPGYAEAQYNLGNTLKDMHKPADAAACYREAIRLEPTYAAAHLNLGNALREQRELDEAAACYREAIRLKPDYAIPHNNLATVLQELGHFEEAVTSYQEAIRLQPDYMEAHRNLGSALKALGRRTEAVASYGQVVRLNPNDADAYHQAGILLMEQWDLEEAIACFQQALRIKPEHIEARNNLGVCYRDQGNLPAAIAAFQEILWLKPDFVMGHYNLGIAHKIQGNLPEALSCFDEALRLDPRNADVHMVKGIACLLYGELEQGWPEYEWRRYCKGFSAAQVGADVPIWDGSPLEGRTIFLAAEQGFGDTIQFVRYSPLVKERGGQVVVGCQKALVPLLKRCAGIDKLVANSADMTPIDVQASLMSLPGIMGTTLANIPAKVPYLHADPELVQKWHAELGAIPGFKVGIAWQGSPRFEMDRLRSVPLRHFVPLGQARGGVFISLQKLHGLEQMAGVAGRLPIVDFGDRLDRDAGAFMDTAAIMKNLDLVITSDSAVAHLAGALGVPVWVALPYIPDWRFLLHREDSPWYPTMRLFRQRKFGDWDEVFERIAMELDQRIKERSSTPAPAPRGNGGGAVMSPIAERLKQAFDYHQAGDFAKAEQVYRAILQADPRHVDALQLLGLLLFQMGRRDLGVQHLREALRYKPDYAEVHNNLAGMLAMQGKREEAIQCHREGLRLKPDVATGHNNLGNTLRDMGRLDEAADSYREAIRLQPDWVEAHNNLGSVLTVLGKPAEAAACFREAVKLKPDCADFYNNLAHVLWELGKPDEAAAVSREALCLKPDCAEAYNNLGNALKAPGTMDEAAACYREAIRLDPSFAVAHNNLGKLLSDQGKLSEAAACYQEAIRIKPDYAEAHFNVALDCLQTGDFERGWAGYEWRWRCKKFGTPALATRRPLWDGSALEGRTIYLTFEQGFGDTLQFIRYARLVHERGGQVMIPSTPLLARLLQRCPGIDHLVDEGALVPPFDVHAPLMSLPRLFGTTMATIPAAVPYLEAEPALVDEWRAKLSGENAIKVGVAWQGRPTHPQDRWRSIPPSHFAALAELPGVHFFSLQKDARDPLPPSTPLPGGEGRGFVTDLESHLNDFMDTAAIMKNLDLVITCDTAIAHLAGALGIPIWVALPLVADWRWLTEREDSPWYPTMRLFRQTERGNWDEVFQRIAAELGKKVGSNLPSPAPPSKGGEKMLASSTTREEQIPSPPSEETPVNDAPSFEGNVPNSSPPLEGGAGGGELPQAASTPILLAEAEAHFQNGVALHHQQRYGEAIAAYEHALACYPAYAEAHNNRAVALMALGRWQDAMASYQEAIRLKPDFAEAHYNLGNLFKSVRKLDEAAACYREAIRVKPDYAEAHNNLAVGLKAQGRVDEAAASYREAIRVNPDNVEAHSNLGQVYLLTGNFEEGWPEYEWRWRGKDFAVQLPRKPKPLWDGTPLEGRTIYLFAEQGMGDTLQFIRYAPLVKERGGQVIVGCQEPLIRLVQTSAGIDQVVPNTADPPPVDVQAPLLSLPRIFGTSVATIPAAVPYLTADPRLVQDWLWDLGASPSFKVGIVWQGNPKNPNDAQRSIPLVQFAPLAMVPGVQLFSLQKGHGAEQLQQAAGRLPVIDLSGRLNDFMDTAAGIKNIDLVITCDTAVAHLAGALGVPVWVALPFAPNWRWLLEREDCPWYPSMRLFRQREPGNWTEVFKRIAGVLASR